MIILIDDDKFIRLSWTLKAKKLGLSILCLESCSSFIAESPGIKKTNPIFVDSNLSRGEKGEIESKKIYQLGFNNIFLCTGYTDLDISDFPWLKGLVTKEFPDFVASSNQV
jgi:hypothetical protein